MSDVSIHLNGITIEGWESVSVYKSMDSIVGAYAFGSADYFPKGLVNFDNLKMDDAIEIKVDNKKLLTGYIDDMDYHFNKNFTNFEIKGRDKPLDLIDCMWDQEVMEWKNQTVINLIRNLCLPYNIQVTLDTNVSNRANQIVETFTADFGRFVYEYVTELCREHGLLPLTYTDGKLTITETTTTRKAFDKLEVKKNVIAGSIRCSNKDRYKTYKCKGSGIGTDEKSLSDFTEPSGYATDIVIKRNRALVMLSETPTTNAQCTEKAIFEKNYRAGNSRKIIHETDSWIQSNGTPWEMNMLVQVKDENAGVEKEMLIQAVEYEISVEEDIGEKAVLHLVDINTYKSTNKKIKLGFDR